MNELALFSGAGGGILGTLLLGFRVVCAVEFNAYRREGLLRRQEEGHLSPFPIWDDARTFDGRPWRGKVDIITAGFPCQPWSFAGKQRGEDDERNMWPDTIRIIGEVAPRYCLLENVPGLLAHKYFGTILRALAEGGAVARWKVVSAAEVGAPHLRHRLWLMAEPEHLRWSGVQVSEGAGARDGASARQLRAEQLKGSGCCEGGAPPLADPDERGREVEWITEHFEQRCPSGVEPDGHDPRGRRKGQALRNPEEYPERPGHSPGEPGGERRRRSGDSDWWATEPGMGRVADGVAYRLDRIAALGDGQVPAVVRAAWDILGPDTYQIERKR